MSRTRSRCSRRTFVSLAATAAAAGCTSTGSDEAAQSEAVREHWVPSGRIDRSSFPCGVQVGDASDDGALVSFRCTRDDVRLIVARGGDERFEVVDDVATGDRGDGTAHVELAGLEPDTEYAVVAMAGDGVRRSRSTRFRTALAPGASRTVRFGVTSCLGPKNPTFPSLAHAFGEELDFSLLLGDTIYADKGEREDRYRYHHLFTRALATRGLGDWCAGTSIVATWDDHEVDNNWSLEDPVTQSRFPEALQAFRRALPQREGPTGGIWRKVSWGDAVDVFMLDLRSERSDVHYVSPQQMQWLKDELSRSTAAFKLIGNPIPIFDFAGTVIGPFQEDDRWQGNREQRKEIVSYIRDEDIPGVLWLSGDVHFGMLGIINRPGGPGDNQWEVICGPGGSRLNPGAKLMKRTERKPILLRKHSWTLFEADPERGTIAMWFVGDDGETLAETQLDLYGGRS